MVKSLINIRYDLSGAQKRQLTTHNIAVVLIDVMRKHIGQNKGITRGELFKKIFLKTEEDSLADWLRWEFVKKAMNYCRKRTLCFITPMRDGREWTYFVVKDEDDADEYCKVIDNTIKNMRKMQRRSQRAAEENWYKQKNWLAAPPEVIDVKTKQIKY